MLVKLKRVARIRSRIPGVTSLYVAGFAFGLLVVLCIVAPIVFPNLPDPSTQDLNNVFSPVGTAGHLLGTDALGRDTLSRVLYGGRISLLIGILAVAIGFFVGGLIGAIAGYFRGWVDIVLSRFIDIILAFPPLILQLAIATLLGASIRNITIALAAYTVPSYARLVRASAIGVREKKFIVSAQLTGARAWRIIPSHVIPNVVRPAIAYSMLTMGTVIILAASLSFLGLGIAPPQADWGGMIAAGVDSLDIAPALVLVPGLFLVWAVLSLNVLNDSVHARQVRIRGEV